MQNKPPKNTKVLCLNQDYTPLNIIGWKRALKRLFAFPCLQCNELGYYTNDGKTIICKRCYGTGELTPATPVEYYEYSIRDSKNREHIIPAVIVNSFYIKRKYKKVPFSKINVLRRDGFRCQYCGQVFNRENLTVDHVVPKSMWNSGTPTLWHNVVCSCQPCNAKKGNKTPEQANMPLKKFINDQFIFYKKPKQPNYEEIYLGFSHKNIPEQWVAYVENYITRNKKEKNAKL